MYAPPTIDGAAGAPARPSELWPVSQRVRRQAVRAAPYGPPPRLGDSLSLAEVVSLALEHNPATRLSWAQARAAADAYGSAHGRWFPTLTGGVNATRSRSLAAPGRPAGERTQYGPSLSLSFLVLDFGGRGGAVDFARQTAIAADLSHNATVANTVLQVEGAAFGYLATRAERDAQRVAVQQAQAALDAANERHRVGLATIADVLQAQTAKSQAELTLESLEGSLAIARGSLAVAMGLPANASYDIPEFGEPDSVHAVTASVDSLIDAAVRNRPELASARAAAAAAAAQIRAARAAMLPSLGFTATGANNAASVNTFSGRTYSLGFGLSIPIFDGLSNQYELNAAREQANAAAARTEITRQQVVQQVFAAYYGLRTATDRVGTSADLLASATQSESVARGRYREGVGSIVDLLIAQSALAAARAQAVESRWQWRTALAQLAHDVGGLGPTGQTSFFSPQPATRNQ